MHELSDVSKGIVKDLKKLVSDLITPDGVPRPGVTAEQFKKAKDTIKRFEGISKKYSKEFESISKEKEKLAVDVNKTREKMIGLEKRFGAKFPPLLRGMYKM